MTQRVVELLRLQMKQAGRGTMARIQRELELRSTFFSESPDRIEVAVVLQVLEQLDISPAAFFSALAQGGDELMPAVPEGCEDIASYYQEGKHLEEADDA
ncbi:MAG: hypothetical protein AAF560_29860 [Acidobacteriota bacterium]